MAFAQLRQETCNRQSGLSRGRSVTNLGLARGMRVPRAWNVHGRSVPASRRFEYRAYVSELDICPAAPIGRNEPRGPHRGCARDTTRSRAEFMSSARQGNGRMFSPSPRLISAPGSRPVAPPPVPLFDTPADDMRRLTVEIDRVLSGRPELISSQYQFSSAALSGAGDEIDLWTVEDGNAAAARAGGASAEQAAGWLGRAKRERRVERARLAVSWTVAILFVAMIAGASAYVVRGELPEPAAVEQFLRSMGL